MERKWWTLIAVSVAIFMLLLDITVVNVALPSIKSDLGFNQSSLAWVVNAYLITFGGLRCPLLAAIGAEDQNPSPEIGAQLRDRAASSGHEVKVDVYEGAGHAFFADYRPTYRPEPAAKLWGEIVPFFARHLQAG